MQEISNIICCPSSELKINSRGGGGDCSQSWLHLFYSCCWLTCDIGAWSLERGKLQCLRKGQAALHSYPHPPSSLATVIRSLWMLIFSDLHIFPEYLCIWITLLLLCFYLSLPLTIHISFSSRRWPSCSETGQPRTIQWHWGAKLPQMHVCVTHSAQQRPHGIYIPHGQSHSDPRDSLIINSNLNLTSNADPRDNIVVMISTQKNPLQVLKLSCFLFAFHAPEFSTTPCLHNRCSSSLQNFLGFSLKRRQIFLQLLMKHNKQLKEFLTT